MSARNRPEPAPSPSPAPPLDLGALFHPGDDLARRNEKLLSITAALIRQVEAMPEDHDHGFAQFQRAAMLEDQVRSRTRDLEHALDLLNTSNARLAEANRETEAARQNLAAAIETVQEGFALFDPEDRMVMCNSRFNVLLPDIVPQLLPGLLFDDYLVLAASSAHIVMPPETTPADWVAMRRARHKEHHFILNQGVGDDRWLQISEHRTHDGGTVILQTEVTDLIRREREERGRLQDDHAQIMRATLDHLTLGVCIFDARLLLLGWNEKLAEYLTLPRTRVRQGMHFDQLLEQVKSRFHFPPGISPHRISDWVRRVRRKDSLSIELTRRGGQIFKIFAQETPGGGFVMSFDDVSAERGALSALSQANETLEARVAARTLELEDALAQAERANAVRARFVAAASHDLLQPLSAATLYLASLPDETMSAPARKTIAKVQRSLDSVEGLLGALLDISRLESGHAAVTLEPIPLAPLFAQLREEFIPLAARKGLQLIVPPVRDAVVISDQVYLRRILQNLISNAIRYTAQGRVFVGLRRRGGDWQAQIRDSGPGIDAADQALIFREFHRLDTKAATGEGLGLGLAIVERAAGQLGHRIGLRSARGCGSTFSVSMCSAAGLSPAHAPPAPQTRTAGPDEEQSGQTVLLVENDAGLARATTELLERWGLTVLGVASGEEALDLIAETGVEPDLCLVDYQLGAGMDGIACLHALRMRFGRDLPARLVTADRSTELRERAREYGIEILNKPVAPRLLGAFIFGSG